MAQNAVGKQCLQLMAQKRTNLAVAVDVATADEMLRLADQVPLRACSGGRLLLLLLIAGAAFVSLACQNVCRGQRAAS